MFHYVWSVKIEDKKNANIPIFYLGFIKLNCCIILIQSK